MAPVISSITPPACAATVSGLNVLVIAVSRLAAKVIGGVEASTNGGISNRHHSDGADGSRDLIMRRSIPNMEAAMAAFYELRQYKIKPGKMKAWLELME